MEVPVSTGERFVVSNLITNKGTTNRTDARLVVNVEDHLELSAEDNLGGSITLDEAKDENIYTLSQLEAEWILDLIEKGFVQEKMPIRLARFALTLEEKLKTTISEHEEELRISPMDSMQAVGKAKSSGMRSPTNTSLQYSGTLWAIITTTRRDTLIMQAHVPET